MRAEILAVGTELLMGEIIDTNSALMAALLPSLGIELRYISELGDDLEQLAEAFRRALERSDVTLVTGGLGPTQDDLTREAIAAALGEEMRVDPALAAQLEQFFRGRGVVMPTSNLKQAALIPSATALPNPRGTAPGWWVERGGRYIAAMPGVPAEFELMWEKEVIPRLRRLPTNQVIISRALKTTGFSESAVAERVQHLFGQGNPYLGIYAKADGIHLRIIAKAPTEALARDLIVPMETEIRRTIGEAVWGTDRETPEERISFKLRQRRQTLATMESCTGGLLASTITDVPGSSEYYRGGFVTYTNEAKIAHGVARDLIAQHGAVSPLVAVAMAEAARTRLGADFGIGITGVAGPAELEGKPVGTVHIGLAWQGETRSLPGRFVPQRHLVKRRAVTEALLSLYRLLEEHPSTE
ncbi:MAG: competence/damage-inducible protein A [Chloroflexi bacterium]|nr:competence/damage-inducible protein A [Chloroflexota bacterium]